MPVRDSIQSVDIVQHRIAQLRLRTRQRELKRRNRMQAKVRVLNTYISYLLISRDRLGKTCRNADVMVQLKSDHLK